MLSDRKNGHAPAVADEPDVSIVGRNLRRLRRRANLTLAQLAQASGLSNPMLSRIEGGSVSPSVATLMKLARALEVGVSAFFDDETVLDQALVVVRAGERRPFLRGQLASGYSYESLAYPRRDKAMEPFIIRYPAGNRDPEMFEHQGEEFLFVLEGTVELHYAGRVELLRPGDAAYLDSDAPHRGYARGDEDAVALSIVTPMHGLLGRLD